MTKWTVPLLSACKGGENEENYRTAESYSYNSYRIQIGQLYKDWQNKKQVTKKHVSTQITQTLEWNPG